EQTLGCGLEPGMDWHYGIQHIAAQTRKLRSVDGGRNIVIACCEASGLSWPAWRKARSDNPALIRKLVGEISDSVKPDRIALVAHSGGGSFITGFINGGSEIPANVETVAYLDANYSYS